MAIKTVPQINGPDFGGVIYGLNMSIGYSSQPSTLTLDIINQNGIYRPPALNSPVKISFGDFIFQGIVWSHNIKQTANESILQITLVDNSIILDRYYVLLWKRGFLNENGRVEFSRKTYDFSDESMLIPVKKTNNVGYPFTDFQEKRLGIISLNDIENYVLPSKLIGSLILVGREKIANSSCDIPDTYYYFNDLKTVLPSIGGNFPNDNQWKATHEGTLREVLNNWASDLGFDFYWDFSNNQIVFFDAAVGVSSIPDIEAPNIISKEKSLSLEGTFNQYGLAYTAMPKQSVKEISTTQNNVILYSVSPISISYFAKKIGTAQSLSIERDTWGAKRSQSAFLEAGFLGFVSRSLRDLYCFQREHWEVLGYKDFLQNTLDKKTWISFLKKTGFDSMIEDLESFDEKGLPNYEFMLISHDQTLADKWHEVEQKLLAAQGQYYRIPDTSGSFFYCNDSSIIEINISVDPEGQDTEDKSLEFEGKKVFSRGGGQFSHDEVSAKEELGYSELISDIQNCAPIIINLKETGLFDTALISELINQEDSKNINSLLIYPSSKKFVKSKIGFDSSLSRGNHPLEQNINDIKEANIKNGRKNCPQYDKNIEKNSCVSYEEVARQKAIKQLQGTSSQTEDLDDYISGLVNKSARSCKINLKSGNILIFGPSDSSYQVVCRYDISVRKISTIDSEPFIFSAGSVGNANNVAEIRVLNENVTDPDEDSFRRSRKSGITFKPKDVIANIPTTVIKYTFAGEPKGIPLNPKSGLKNLDISLSSDGFTTSATFGTRPPKPPKTNNTVRYVHSQFNRSSYNAS